MNIKMNLSLAASAVLAGTIMVSGCGSSSNNSTPNSSSSTSVSSVSSSSVSSEAAKSTVRLKVVETDGVTPVVGATVTFVETLKRKAPLVTDSNGEVLITLDGNVARINTLVSKEGYLGSGIEVILDEVGDYARTLKLVNLTSGTTQGITVQATQATTQNGATTAPVSITSDKGSVTIPQGVVMKDTNGNTVSGAVKIEVVNFSSDIDDDAMEAFPGGLSVTAVVEGSERETNFISAGFVSVRMTDETGNVVKTFENGSVELTMDVDMTALNPETGLPIKPGDAVPVWSYDTVTGQWTYETTAIVGNDGKVTFAARHLSYWNLDWDFTPNACRPANITVQNVPANTPYQIKFTRDGYSTMAYNFQGDSSNVVYNVPGTVPLSISLMDAYGNVKQTTTATLKETNCALTMQYDEPASSSSSVAQSSSSVVSSSSSVAQSSSSVVSSSSSVAQSSSSVVSSSSSVAQSSSSSSVSSCSTQDVTLSAITFMGNPITVSNGVANTNVTIQTTTPVKVLSFTMDKCVAASNLSVTLEVADKDSLRYIAATASPMSITCQGNNATASLDTTSTITFIGRDSEGDIVTGTTVDNQAANILSSNGLTVYWNFDSLIQRLQNSSSKFADELNVFQKVGNYDYTVILGHQQCASDATKYADFDVTNFVNGTSLDALNMGIFNASGESFSGSISVVNP